MYLLCISQMYVMVLLRIKTLLLSQAKRVTLYLRSSFSMMYPTGPQLNTQGFPEHLGEEVEVGVEEIS